MKPRQCGTCNACCTAIRVPDFDNPAYTPCAYLSPIKGCSIHAARPQNCRNWDCAWLLGQVPKEHRPDRLGLVISVIRSPELGSEETWVLHEAWPGAFDSPKVREFAQALEGVALVCYVARDETKRITTRDPRKIHLPIFEEAK